MGYHNKEQLVLTVIGKYDMYIVFFLTIQRQCFRYFPYHQTISVLTVYDHGLR